MMFLTKSKECPNIRMLYANKHVISQGSFTNYQPTLILFCFILCSHGPVLYAYSFILIVVIFSKILLSKWVNTMMTMAIRKNWSQDMIKWLQVQRIQRNTVNWSRTWVYTHRIQCQRRQSFRSCQSEYGRTFPATNRISFNVVKVSHPASVRSEICEIIARITNLLRDKLCARVCIEIAYRMLLKKEMQLGQHYHRRSCRWQYWTRSLRKRWNLILYIAELISVTPDFVLLL